MNDDQNLAEQVADLQQKSVQVKMRPTEKENLKNNIFDGITPTVPSDAIATNLEMTWKNTKYYIPTTTFASSVTDATLPFSDITTNDVSTSKHGFAPKLPGDSTKFLNGAGAYAVPPGIAGNPAGSDKQVQFNDSGAFGASADFIYDDAGQEMEFQQSTEGDFTLNGGAGGTGTFRVRTDGGSLNLENPHFDSGAGGQPVSLDYSLVNGGGSPVVMTVQPSDGTIAYLSDLPSGTLNGLFGDGSDGSAAFDGTSTPAGTSKSSNTYTLLRDVYYTDATVSSAVTIITNSFRIFCSGTLTTQAGSVIHNNGASGGNGATGLSGGAGGTAGTTIASGTLPGGTAGVIGGAGGVGTNGSGPGGAGTIGNNGIATTNSWGASSSSPGSNQSGAGGAANAFSGGAAAGGGSSASATASLVGPHVIFSVYSMATLAGTVVTDSANSPSAGGGGGGAGSFTGHSHGGHGGGGGGTGSTGGFVVIFAQIISCSGTIESLGGDGGNGGNGGDATTDMSEQVGGGGGGQGGFGGTGGVVIIVAHSYSGNAPVVTGGSHGAGGSGGAQVNGGGVGTSGQGGVDGASGVAVTLTV